MACRRRLAIFLITSLIVFSQSVAIARSQRPVKPVDVNTATAAELEQIKGVGPSLAARIVAARNQGGRFRDAEELRQRVRGIGEANLKRMLGAGLLVSGPARVEPIQAAQRNRIDLVVGNAPSKAERPHPERFRTQSPTHASPTVAQAQAVRTRVQKERTPEHRANSGPTHGQGRIEELACCKAGGTYTSAQDTAAPP